MYIVSPGNSIVILLPYASTGFDGSPSGGFPLADATLQAVAKDAYDAAGYTAEFTITVDTPIGYLELRMESAESIKLVPGRRYDVSVVATENEGQSYDITMPCASRVRLYVAPSTSDGLGAAIDDGGTAASTYTPGGSATLTVTGPDVQQQRGGVCQVSVATNTGLYPSFASNFDWCVASAWRKDGDGHYYATLIVAPNKTGWKRTATVTATVGTLSAHAHIEQEG